MSSFLRDLRYGIRGLLRAPVFTLTTLFVLTLGIGANTALFSALEPVLFRALPFPRGDELVIVRVEHAVTGQSGSISFPDYLDYRAKLTAFADLAAFRGATMELGGLAKPERARGAFVTGNFFSTLGTGAHLGRTLDARDDAMDGPPVAVLTYEAWARLYDRDAGIVGRTILVDGRGFQVVGVLSPAFGVFAGSRADGLGVFVPLHFYTDAEALHQRGMGFLLALGRLRSGVSAEQATREAAPIAEAIEKSLPEPGHVGYRPIAIPLRRWTLGEFREVAILLLVAVALVQLIACANVGNLLLVRSMARQREFATRLVLGASRAQLVRQLLTEAMVLSLAAAACGLAVAVQMTGILSTWLGPRVAQITVNGRVLSFTLASTLLALVLFALLPSFTASRVDLHEALKGAGSRASAGRAQLRLKNVLIAAQIAVAFGLLTGAALMLKSLSRLTTVHPGFQAENMLMVGLQLPSFRYSNEQKRAFYLDVMERLAAQPGITAAAVGSPFPLNDGHSRTGVKPEGHEPPVGDSWMADMYEVSTDYFRTMGIPLLHGRTFVSADGAADAEKVMLVNATFAARFWPDGDAIGHRVMENGRPHTIVGVVGDVRHGGLDQTPQLQFYVPFELSRWVDMNLLLRVDGRPEQVAKTVQRILSDRDPELFIPPARLATEILGETTQGRRATAYLLEAFACLALALATIGLYGLVSYAVAQRQREFAIRVVLGASSREIARLVLRQGLTVIACGFAGGLVLSLASANLFRGIVFGITPTDPATYAIIVALLGATTLAALIGPAYRASKIDPNLVLRAD